MNFIIFPDSHSEQKELVLKLNTALNLLSEQFKNINIHKLNISIYTKNYFQKYISNFPYFASHYAQLMLKATKELKKPIKESVFVDYGGGSGLLSLIAKLIGFKKVIYCDIYDVSAQDAQIISETINVNIDNFIVGDISDIVSFCKEKEINPDLFCSFDVLEHIYDLKHWFSEISKLKNKFSIVFTTGANTYNPLINKKLKQSQYQVENLGKHEDDAWKQRDISSAFINERKKIISEYNTELPDKTIEYLAKNTRGLKKSDIEKEVNIFLINKKLNYKPDHKSNTCDPYTGNWEERLLTKKILRKTINSNDFEVKIRNNFFAYSEDKKLNFFKHGLNIFIKTLPNNLLCFSPSYTLICNRI